MSLVRELELVRCSDGRLRVTQEPQLPTDATRLQVFDVQVPSAPGDRTDVVLGSDDPHGGRVTITVDGDERTITCDRTRSGAVDFHPAFPSVDTAPLLGDDDPSPTSRSSSTPASSRSTSTRDSSRSPSRSSPTCH